MPAANANAWAVVLAAGEGRRLSPVTRALYGEDRPKQFAVLSGNRSLLQTTMHRLGGRFRRERTVVVVSEQHAPLAYRQLASFSGIEVVVQPQNLGTGPGILLPLTRISAREPDAVVAVLPSDHDLPNPPPFLEALDVAVDSARSGGSSLSLLGIVPEGPEREYGWIVPESRPQAQDLTRPLGVARFVEKPAPGLAAELLEDGGLWNSFVLVGRARSFLELADVHLPAQAASLREYAQSIGRPDEVAVLRRAYELMAPADWSRALLERARGLEVVPVGDSGWSDWGTPARLFRGLRSRAELAPLLARIRERARSPAVRTRGERSCDDDPGNGRLKPPTALVRERKEPVGRVHPALVP